MRNVEMLLFAALLTGCANQAPRTLTQRVNVPVPIACQEPVPVRPIMPTESLGAGVGLDVFSKAAIAEIERREGYELRLRTALDNCRLPVSPQ